MNIKHEIDKENGTVTVTATLEPRKGMKIRVSQQHVKDYLNKENIKTLKCIQDACAINTIPPYSGTWVFSLDNGKPPVVKSMYENVSIPQEETKAESPRAKTRRKKTTKTKEA